MEMTTPTAKRKPKYGYEGLDKKELRHRLRWHTVAIMIKFFILWCLTLNSETAPIIILEVVVNSIFMTFEVVLLYIIAIPLTLFGIINLSAFLVAAAAKPNQRYIYQLIASVVFTLSLSFGIALYVINV